MTNIITFLNKYSYPFGSYSFTIGCLFFTLDALTYKPIRKKYLCGCLLFDIGCVFFIIDSHKPVINYYNST